MSHFPLNKTDMVFNRLKTHPFRSFFINDSVVRTNQKFPRTTLTTETFITKTGSRESFKTVSSSQFNQDFNYGDSISSSSLIFQKTSLRREYHLENSSRPKIEALRNTLENYAIHSPAFIFGDKSTSELSLIEIPSLFYGSSIEKGSVILRIYENGSLMGELKDEKRNGELIQIFPQDANSGKVAGVCLYKEGFIMLTGLWALNEGLYNFLNDNTNLVSPSWVHFGVGIEESFTVGALPSIGFELEFNGTQHIPSMTMFCRAPKGSLNYSNNPTFLEDEQNRDPLVSTDSYREPDNLKIANVVSAAYSDPEPEYEPVTYISQINLYDEDKNLIGVAKLATPVKKTMDRELVFKLKYDI